MADFVEWTMEKATAISAMKANEVVNVSRMRTSLFWEISVGCRLHANTRTNDCPERIEVCWMAMGMSTQDVNNFPVVLMAMEFGIVECEEALFLLIYANNFPVVLMAMEIELVEREEALFLLRNYHQSFDQTLDRFECQMSFNAERRIQAKGRTAS